MHHGDGAVDVTPDLGCSERDEEAKQDPQRRQQARRNGLEGAGALGFRDEVDDCKDRGGKKVSRTEYGQRHPWYREVMQPVGHFSPVFAVTTRPAAVKCGLSPIWAPRRWACGFDRVGIGRYKLRQSTILWPQMSFCVTVEFR